MTRGEVLKTFSNFGIEFEIELKIRLNEWMEFYDEWTSVLHITEGGRWNTGSRGDRISLILIRSSKVFHFAHGLDNNLYSVWDPVSFE